ncbi:hypothetical protein [Euzebya tangerina]|uniref:hypothetical protein n=1 Tax=Euzebya tangerina TaxID=591198 RepID=UPI000E30D920|nr:hypothetical protein [Euzebya tangerina]
MSPEAGRWTWTYVALAFAGYWGIQAIIWAGAPLAVRVGVPIAIITYTTAALIVGAAALRGRANLWTAWVLATPPLVRTVVWLIEFIQTGQGGILAASNYIGDAVAVLAAWQITRGRLARYIARAHGVPDGR